MPHLLLVQDDKILGECTKEYLEEYGYKVTWLERGDDADKILQDHNFDLIILNAGLPGLPGQDVMQSFRAQGKTTPVIMTSANPFLEKECLQAGADCFLDVPDTEDLRQVIEKYLPVNADAS